ncbi:hypothetical protein GCM10020001_079910 [Nonomuraea salmonea]
MSMPMVHARAVRKHFGHLEVLKGIDLDVQAGEVVVVLGPSGSGKSTFLRCVNHLETIDGGAIHVDGELIGFEARAGKVRHLRKRDITRQRREIGMVFQQFNLFPHMTVLQNVMEAPRRRPPRAARAGQGTRARAAAPRRPGGQGGQLPPASSPAASSSASRSPGPWPCGPSSCCSTSPPAPSTPSWSARCWPP